jgi:hypothetical protein
MRCSAIRHAALPSCSKKLCQHPGLAACLIIIIIESLLLHMLCPQNVSANLARVRLGQCFREHDVAGGRREMLRKIRAHVLPDGLCDGCCGKIFEGVGREALEWLRKLIGCQNYVSSDGLAFEGVWDADDSDFGDIGKQHYAVLDFGGAL